MFIRAIPSGGAPFPTFARVGAIATAAASAGTISAALPASWRAGHYGVLIIGSARSGAGVPTISTPSGWTLIGSVDNGAVAAPDGLARMSVFGRVFTSDQTNPTSTLTNDTDGSCAVILSYSNVAQSSSTEAFLSSSDVAAGTTQAYLEPTTLGARRLVLQVMLTCQASSALGELGPPATPAAGWTERLDNYDSSVSQVNLIVHDRTFLAAGAVPAANMTIGYGILDWGKIAFALKPLF
jgi:hypothetical protein